MTDQAFRPFQSDRSFLAASRGTAPWSSRLRSARPAGSGDGDGSREASIILEIEDAIAKINATSGLAILLVEQYMEFALRLATRYVVLDAGRVAASGKTSTFDPATVRPLLAV